MPEVEKFYIFTLGCKINQYESQVLLEAWQRQGFKATDQPEQAEHILINSCAVTERAVQDLRRAVRRLNRASPGARIVLTGCAASGGCSDLGSLPGVSQIIPQQEKQRLMFFQDSPAGPGPQAREFCSLQGIADFPRARPVLKVQDGCSSNCSYCIVPITRGKSRSRPPGQILQEANDLVQAGFQELVLSGINLAQFRFAGKGGFWELLHWLDGQLFSRWGDRLRLRLSSLDPALLGPKALRVLDSCRLVCPHLHLSLQSASPRILQNMGRNNYSILQIQDFLASLVQVWPLYALGADILLGFPGETQEDFKRTMQFCQEQPLSYAHVFTYSPRPGTRAAKFPEQVPSKLKKMRSQELRLGLEAKKEVFWHVLSAKDKLEVVLEQTDPALGLCEYYVPCMLRDPHPLLAQKQKLWVKPVGYNANGILVSMDSAAPVPVQAGVGQ